MENNKRNFTRIDPPFLKVVWLRLKKKHFSINYNNQFYYFGSRKLPFSRNVTFPPKPFGRRLHIISCAPFTQENDWLTALANHKQEWNLASSIYQNLLGAPGTEPSSRAHGWKKTISTFRVWIFRLQIQDTFKTFRKTFWLHFPHGKTKIDLNG